MAERALRGSRLGSVSYENEHGTQLAPRIPTAFECPRGHTFWVPFAEEAEIPASWDCRTCGSPARAVAGPREPDQPVKHVRSHWDMLLERRSRDDLEQVLAERLAVLRGKGKKSA